MPETDHKPKEIAVDLDATLVEYTTYKGARNIGKPIPAMVEKIKDALANGDHVRIFTARVHPGETYERAMDATVATLLIAGLCFELFGQVLPITCIKTPDISEFWDDRAREVEANEGTFVGE